MPGPARQLRFDTLRNAELARATSAKPIRASTLSMVTASGVAGEGCRWGRMLKMQQDPVI
jgi:hypothetical protein